MEKNNTHTKIMIWFKAYDLMYMYADDSQKQDFNNLVDSIDRFYAADDDSYQSACERVYDDKVRMLPEEINNTADATAHIKAELLLEEDVTNLDIIGPERLKSELLGDSDDAPVEYSDMGKDLRKMTNEEVEDAVERMPGRIGEQMKGLMEAIEEVNDNASSIFTHYVEESASRGISKEQAKEEAEAYMTGEIPAAEFIAPVAILDNLKDL